MSKVRVKRLKPGARVPQYMSAGASGCDVFCCLDAALEIPPGKRVAVPTGLAVEVPSGYEIQVRPRSGFAFKKGLTVVNAPGTIDSDYRGEVMVLMINLGHESVTIAPGDRVAQFVLQQVETIAWEEAGELAATSRDAGGFGSTGVNVQPPGT